MISLTSDAAIMYGLALISAMLSCGLFLSWKLLGGARHTLIWASAFAIGAVQWAVIAGYNSYWEETPLTFLGSTWCGGFVAILLCVGFRERVGLPRRTPWIVAAALVTALMVVVPEWTGYRQYTLATPQFVRAVAVGLAILTLAGPGRRPASVEWMAVVILLALVALSLVVGYLRLVDCGCETNNARVILLVGLPVLYTGTGLATVLLLTADLARQLRRVARIDPLTDILNRRGFDEAAGRLLGQARRKARPISVLLFDLDHFKAINDNFGHGVGDDVLRAVAHCVREECRQGDTLGRLGGEEFLILADNMTPLDAMVTAERIRQAIAALSILPDGGKVTASFGVAALHADEGLSPALARADRALYRAKAGGRNRTGLFVEESDGPAPSPQDFAAAPNVGGKDAPAHWRAVSP